MAGCRLTFMKVSINFVQTELTVDTLMRQMKLPFNVEDLLHIYKVVRPRRELSTPFLAVSLSGFQVSGSFELGMMVSGHSRGFKEDNRHPCVRVVLSVGKFWSRAQCESFPARIQGWEEGKEEKEEEEIPKLVLNRRNWVIPETKPEVPARLISISSSDLAFNPLQLIGQKRTTPAAAPLAVAAIQINQEPLPAPAPTLACLRGPSKKSKTKKGEGGSNGQAELWKPEFSTAKLDKQVTVANSATNHDTKPPKVCGCLGARGNSHPSLRRQKKMVGSLDSELNKAKLALAATDQLKADLGWLACLAELGIPEDNPTWAKAAPAAELPESPEPYSPLILPGFNEEDRHLRWFCGRAKLLQSITNRGLA
ncbi:hypothetical protein Acr_24g0010220 [Actinidia rufa]|uniref:Uncharacterized protein n=1 Tax=Actinidia rufa TaxID=165716 RepID=A0A7J0GVM1_9ERIC|nr:hypothetical protein Acr_24g0010220 [Actinidia rufa]